MLLLLSGPRVKNAGVTQLCVPRGRNITVGYMTGVADEQQSETSAHHPADRLKTQREPVIHVPLSGRLKSAFITSSVKIPSAWREPGRCVFIS